MDKGAFLYRKSQEIIQALEKTDQRHTSTDIKRREHWVRWEPPEGGWRVLNTDGAARGTLGLAGAGGVLRGDHGEWILGFSEHLGCCSAIKGELRAVLRGLKLAKEAKTRQLLIQLDSTAAVSMLTGHSLCHSECSGIIQQCKNLMGWGGWEVRIIHCFREANQVADGLANMGLDGTLEVKTYHVPPTKIREYLYADQMGATWPRFRKG